VGIIAFTAGTLSLLQFFDVLAVSEESVRTPIDPVVSILGILLLITAFLYFNNTRK